MRIPSVSPGESPCLTVKSCVDLEENLVNLQSKYPPSEIVKDATKIKEFSVDCRLYRNQVPVALFSGALAKLQANLEKNDDTVTPQEVALAATYITQAIASYGDETQNAIFETIDSALGSKSVWIILERKNCPGIGGDPILQCIMALSKIIASSKVLSHIHRKCAC